MAFSRSLWLISICRGISNYWNIQLRVSEPAYRFLALWQWGRDLWEAPGYPGGCWLYSWAQSAPCAGTSPDWTPRAAADRSLKKVGDGERKVSKTIQSSYCGREPVDPTTNICICRVLIRPPRGWSWVLLQIWSQEKLFIAEASQLHSRPPTTNTS